MQKTKRILSWKLCLLFVFGSILLQNVSADTRRSISLRGRWSEAHRSTISSIPITVNINDGVLSIHSSTQRSDITICISKEGEVLYEEMVPASETGCIMIDLGDFDPGVYSIELKNQWGDYLWGELDI